MSHCTGGVGSGCSKVALLGWLVWLVLPAAAEAQVKYADLQKLVREALNNGEVAVEPPNLEVKEGVMFFELGGGNFINPGPFEFNPMDQVLHGQLRVEVIRKHRSSPKQQQTWKPVLEQVEQVIAQKLEAVQDAKLEEKDRLNRLAELDDQTEKIYDEAVASFARANGWKVGRRYFMRPPHMVKLVTAPPGGQVFLTHALQMRLATSQGKDPQWKLVADPSSVELEGKYYYLVRWGDRTLKGEDPFLVDRNGTFVLR